MLPCFLAFTEFFLTFPRLPLVLPSFTGFSNGRSSEYLVLPGFQTITRGVTEFCRHMLPCFLAFTEFFLTFPRLPLVLPSFTGFSNGRSSEYLVLPGFQTVAPGSTEFCRRMLGCYLGLLGFQMVTS